MNQLIFIVLIWFSPVVCHSQHILLNKDINVLELLTMNINEANEMLGKASKIERFQITQPFCGITRGRDEVLTYRKHGLSITTWKKLGYVDKDELNKRDRLNYYKNCKVQLLQFSGEANLRINAHPLDSLNEVNLDEALANFAEKVGDNQYAILKKDGQQYILSFILKDGRVESLTIELKYS